MFREVFGSDEFDIQQLIVYRVYIFSPSRQESSYIAMLKVSSLFDTVNTVTLSLSFVLST